jgi:hypothetical protein
MEMQVIYEKNQKYTAKTLFGIVKRKTYQVDHLHCTSWFKMASGMYPKHTKTTVILGQVV